MLQSRPCQRSCSALATLGVGLMALAKTETDQQSSRQLQDLKKPKYHHHLYAGIDQRVGAKLSEIDGLKNTEVAVIITSTAKNGGALLRERIIPSSRTWMKHLANVFVVIEDTFQIRYSLRHCHREDFYTSHQNYTSFACDHEPTYILSRVCADTYYVAEGMCCKVDEGISYVVHARSQDIYPALKYLVHSDDDTFWRVDQLLRWLAAVENTGLSLFPIVGNNYNFPGPFHGFTDGVWHINGCKEIHTAGWYQPVMFNRAALERIKASTAVFGITDVCTEFVMSQDGGIGVFLWMFDMYNILLPGVEINNMHRGEEVFQPQLMSVHGIRHHADDHCDEPEKWPDEIRYNQKMAVGCGDVDRKGPFHDAKGSYADMYDAWAYFRDHGEDLPIGEDGQLDWQWYRVTYTSASQAADGKSPPVKHILQDTEVVGADGLYGGDSVHKALLPKMYKLSGYETTKHSKENDVSKQWAHFSLADCAEPGSIQ